MRCAPVLLLATLTACGGGGTDPSDPDGSTVDAPATIDAPADPDAQTPDGPTSPDGGTATDPAGNGTWQVVTQATVTIPLGSAGNVTGSIFSPSTNGTTPAPGPFPLIVVSSGFQLARGQYRTYCEHLATRGHVCITHEYASQGNHQAKAREVIAIIDWALSPASGLAPRVRADAIGVAGHSLGGKVSINAAILDTRIRAVVGWDPVDALPPFSDGSTSVTPELMANLRVPVALLGELTDSTGGIGGMSCAPAADNYQQFFNAACEATATLEVTVTGADHMDWLGDRATCGLACFACANGQTADTVVQTITRRVTAAWFARHLGGDLSMDAWLTAAAVGTPTTVRTSPGC